MFDGLFTPAFLQSACAHRGEPAQNVIRLQIGNDLGEMYKVIADLSYTGSVTAEYTTGGVTHTQTITEDTFECDPDAHTIVTITGNVTRLSVGAPPNGIITGIDADDCKSLMSLITSQRIETLKISKYLTSLDVRGTNIKSIYYPANNNAVSTAIENAITNASANNGTVYTDPNGTYYDTIAQAATAKGWTIEEL